jgi:hypothetical protein
MFLRKLNAVFSLICTILILDHSIFLSIWMVTRGGIEKTENPLPRILVICMILHAVISITLGILGHKNAEKRKCNTYAKENRQTIIQRISGILIIILIVFHIAGAINHFQPKILHAIIHPVFFIVVLAHVAVSTSKAFITLGIGNARAIKIIDIVIKVVCALTIIACIVGFYLCLFVGVGK